MHLILHAYPGGTTGPVPIFISLLHHHHATSTMSRLPNLESVAGDPLIGSDLATFSPSHSRPGHHSVLSAHSSESMAERRSEHEPLLGPGRPRKPFYRARPLWCDPVYFMSCAQDSLHMPQASAFRHHGGADSWHDYCASSRGLHTTRMFSSTPTSLQPHSCRSVISF